MYVNEILKGSNRCRMTREQCGSLVVGDEVVLCERYTGWVRRTQVTIQRVHKASVTVEFPKDSPRGPVVVQFRGVSVFLEALDDEIRAAMVRSQRIERVRGFMARLIRDFRNPGWMTDRVLDLLEQASQAYDKAIQDGQSG